MKRYAENFLLPRRPRHRVCLLFFALLLSAFHLPSASEARENIAMYVGEVRVLKISQIERVAIGNPKVASNTILPEGQLVVLADAVGVTTMHIWLQDGSEKEFDVTVKDKQEFDNHQELVRLLANVPGVTAEKNGETSVVRGQVSLQDKPRLDRILTRYSNVLDLVKVQDTIGDVSSLLDGIPGITVREIGGNTVITGEVDSSYDKVIKIIEGKYPNVLNLTRMRAAVAGQMVYMKVRIMEMNKNITEKLGINWNALGVPGPSFEFGIETDRGNSTILNNNRGEVPASLKKSGNTNLTSATGYFGIATGIGSVINLMESTADAVTLAEPRLSTRSGGTAEFLAGGEFPVPITNSLGGTDVEFKKYGISLNIAPVVDDQHNILAHIETEISDIDHGRSSVGNIPGVLTRRTYTDVSLRAEETLVIAGLIKNDVSKNYSNVKWLSDFPVLGPLFRSKDFQNDQTELVIFITPYVYDASSSLNNMSLQKAIEIKEEFEKISDGKHLLE